MSVDFFEMHEYLLDHINTPESEDNKKIRNIFLYCCKENIGMHRAQLYDAIHFGPNNNERKIILTYNYHEYFSIKTAGESDTWNIILWSHHLEEIRALAIKYEKYIKNMHTKGESVNLRTLYKTYYSRFKRGGSVFIASRNAAKNFAENPNTTNLLDLIKEEKLSARAGGKFKDYKYPEMVIAFLSGMYYYEAPKIYTYGLQDCTKDSGHIYLFDLKNNNVKFGYTAIPLQERFRKFIHRYDFPNACIAYSRPCKNPQLAERDIQELLKSYRKSGTTTGESNEIYNIDIQHAIYLIDEFFKKQ